jgi:hypothetical protein
MREDIESCYAKNQSEQKSDYGADQDGRQFGAEFGTNLHADSELENFPFVAFFMFR